MSVKLSVIIPCYNEQNRFQEGFNHYFQYLKRQKYLWELIFVNDGSTDNTLELIKLACQKSPLVTFVSYSKNHGKGYAICQGVKKASGKQILFTDIDYSVPIKTIESFFKYFEKGFDCVIGSRRVKGARILIRQPKLREFLGKGFTQLVRILIDSKIKDSTCGFKAFESKVAKKIFGKITIYDWAFDAEILFICKRNNIKYIQAPVAWEDKRGSKVSPIKDVFNSLLGLIKIRINDLKNQYQ